jgi:hypothetical protein
MRPRGVEESDAGVRPWSTSDDLEFVLGNAVVISYLDSPTLCRRELPDDASIRFGGTSVPRPLISPNWLTGLCR